jgi:4-hydroxybenzoate polyprenyltransferase
MTLADAIRLGRVSNLPTVWTNVCAGIVLSGGVVWDARAALALVAMSLAYVGGMYLNDAFDADIDARERSSRPIPSGRVPRRVVFAAGFALLAASVLLLLFAGSRPALAGVALAAVIVLYDWRHKDNPIGPVLMGLCRALVYVVAGLCFVAALPTPLVMGAALLLGYIVGLTYLAKQETLGRVANLWPLLFLALPILYGVRLAMDEPLVWLFLAALAALVALAVRLAARRAPGDIGKAIVLLLAGICLFDAMLIAGAGEAGLAVLAAAGFPLTLLLQRLVPGT